MLSTNPRVEGKVEPLPYHTPAWRGQGRGGEPPPHLRHSPRPRGCSQVGSTTPPPFDSPRPRGCREGGAPPLPTLDLPKVEVGWGVPPFPPSLSFPILVVARPAHFKWPGMVVARPAHFKWPGMVVARPTLSGRDCGVLAYPEWPGGSRPPPKWPELWWPGLP